MPLKKDSLRTASVYGDVIQSDADTPDPGKSQPGGASCAQSGSNHFIYEPTKLAAFLPTSRRRRLRSGLIVLYTGPKAKRSLRR